MSELPADACSYWQRAQMRDIDETGFGCSPFDLMTEKQVDLYIADQDAADEKDPPCGTCTCCVCDAEAHEQDVIDRANAFDDGGL